MPIVCIGLNLLFGYAGQISLGHAGFFGLGAYGSTLLSVCRRSDLVGYSDHGLLRGPAVVHLWARLILRLAGHYLAMATLGIGIVIWTMLVREIGLTGGPDGMSVAPIRIGELFRHWSLALVLASSGLP